MVSVLGDRDPVYEDYDKLTLCYGVMNEVNALLLALCNIGVNAKKAKVLLNFAEISSCYSQITCLGYTFTKATSALR